MPIESASFIADLDANNPDGTVDTKSTLDNHDRLIKSCLKATLPGFGGRFRRIQAKSDTYTAVLNDNSSIIRTSNSWTLALTAAATLGNGWELLVYNDGAGTITVDPNASETINGAATLAVPPSSTLRIWCDGSNFFAALTTFSSPFPSGTLMLFQQTSAPTGWTKQSTHNDKALRVVSGSASSGGVTGFTTVFGSSKSTGSYTLLTNDIPSHTHTGTTNSTGAHTHTTTIPNDNAGSTNQATSLLNTVGTSTAWASSSDGAHTHAFTSDATGGGGGHSHTLSLDLAYVDLIIASKD